MTADIQPSLKEEEFDLDRFKAGHILVYQTQGGFVQKQIQKTQADMGLPLEHTIYTHVEVSTGGPFAINVSPPRVREMDIRDAHAGQTK